MLDRRSISLFLSFLLFLDLAASFYLKEEKYKNEIGEFEEVETITDPAKVKLLMAQPAKEKFKFIQVLIPDQFSKYDSIDHDGHISLKELIRTTGAERNAKNAFQAADKDADGEISREEFKKAPWSMKPTSGNSEDREENVEEVKFETEEIEMDNGGNKNVEEEEEEEEEEETSEKYEEEDKESFIEIVEGRAKDFVMKNEEKEKLERVEIKGDKEGEKQVLIEENDEEEEEEEEEKPVEGKVGGIKAKKETEEKQNVKVGMGEVEQIEKVKNESAEATEKRSKQEDEDEDEEKHKKEEIEEKNLEKNIEHFDHERLDSEKHVEGSSQVEFAEDDEESNDWDDSNETSGESNSDQETDSEDEERKPIDKENDESFND